MNVQHDGELAQLGRSAAWAIRQGLEAYGRSDPQGAAELVAALEAGTVHVRLSITSGGGEPSKVEAAAVNAEGIAWAFATMTVAPLQLN